MSSSERIKIGIICECDGGSEFGWLYSFYGYSTILGEKPYSAKLFYSFKKSANHSLKKGTIVAFISLNDILGYAVNVMEIKELPFLYAESNEDEIQYRKKNVLPYWEIHYQWRFDYCCLFFPYKKNKSQPAELQYKILYGKELEIFKLLYALNESSFKPLSLNAITNHIQEIKDYISGFSLENILETYICGESGYFQCRPGRDDSYNTTVYKTIESNDEYIKSIIPLGKESDSTACVGRGIDDEDYDKINVAETETGKQIARAEYTKEKHIAFLVNAFFEKYYSEKLKYEDLISDLKELGLSDRFRYDKFGYGELSYERVTDTIKVINSKVLDTFNALNKIK